MTINTKTAVALLCVIVALFALFFFLKGCGDKPVTPIDMDAVQRSRDSLIQKEKVTDSINSDLYALLLDNGVVRDSLIKLVGVKDAQLSVKAATITGLTKEAKLYRKYNDTASYITSCDTLINEVQGLVAQLSDYQYDVGVLRDSLSSAVGINSLIIAQKDYIYGELRKGYNSVYDSLGKSNAITIALQKKNKKQKIAGGIVIAALLAKIIFFNK